MILVAWPGWLLLSRSRDDLYCLSPQGGELITPEAALQLIDAMRSQTPTFGSAAEAEREIRAMEPQP